MFTQLLNIDVSKPVNHPFRPPPNPFRLNVARSVVSPEMIHEFAMMGLFPTGKNASGKLDWESMTQLVLQQDLHLQYIEWVGFYAGKDFKLLSEEEEDIVIQRMIAAGL